jgi:hypothetical protein
MAQNFCQSINIWTFHNFYIHPGSNQIRKNSDIWAKFLGDVPQGLIPVLSFEFSVLSFEFSVLSSQF